MQITITMGYHYLRANSHFKMATIRGEKAKRPSAREGGKQLERPCTAGGEAEQHSCSQRCLAVSGKVKHLQCASATQFLGILLKRIIIHVHLISVCQCLLQLYQ